jgi:hypothetical protein
MKAERKGLTPSLWSIYNLVAWLVGEFLGVLLYSKIFNVDMENADTLLRSNPLSYILFQVFILLTGLLGYSFVDRKLNGYPDAK